MFVYDNQHIRLTRYREEIKLMYSSTLILKNNHCRENPKHLKIRKPIAYPSEGKKIS